MAKINRKIPLRVREARRKDYQIGKEMKDRLSVSYPLCIGTFPECDGLKAGQLCSDCKSCVHFSERNYQLELNRINGVVEMKKKETKVSDRSQKEKESRDEKIRRILEKPVELWRPVDKAWMKIWGKKGLVEDNRSISKEGIVVQS
jgi:hypothetical protein